MLLEKLRFGFGLFSFQINGVEDDEYEFEYQNVKISAIERVLHLPSRKFRRNKSQIKFVSINKNLAEVYKRKRKLLLLTYGSNQNLRQKSDEALSQIQKQSLKPISPIFSRRWSSF